MSPEYIAWYRRELEHQRPAKRPHIQDFTESSQEQWGWLAKEEGYQAEISKLKQQIRALKFENSVQVAADQGEKNRLAQENEALRAQIQQMRIAANNQQRSQSDEWLIKGMKREIGECQDELKKSEGTIAELRAQWKDYEKAIGSLKRKVVTLEDKAVKQAKTFETESGHCYDLLARMEVEIQQLQDQHFQDSHVLEARNNQPQEPPTVNSSPSFPLYQQCQGTTSHTLQAPPSKQVSYPSPPITPVFVAPPPATLHRSPSEPLFQTLDNQYYPPEPTFKVPEPYSYTPHLDLTPGTKKPPKDPEQEEMIRKVKSLEQSFRDMRGLGGQAPEAPNINQNPLPAHHEANMIELLYEGAEPKKPSHMVMMIRSIEAKEKENAVRAKPTTQPKGVNDKPVVVIGKGSSIIAKKPEPTKLVVPGASSAPAVVVKGAYIEPVVIKPVVQLPVVDIKVVPWKYEKVVVTYKGKEIEEKSCDAQRLTRSGCCFAPEELRKARVTKDNPVLVKKVVTEEEAEEFLKKMKVQDYSIVEQLRKTPTQISLLSLLIQSDEHRRALMKILNKARVPEKFQVTFSDDELPVEGTEHNKALYLTVKCEDSVVTRVLIDNGSSANICPLSTLNKLRIEDDRIHKNSVCVRGFDGGGTDIVGDIILELTIGPVEFTMEFQVLDVAVSYKLLLGRPWIHAAKAVPSTLH
ncbi:uncharacterized protein [Nicotiana sylvestris]|uniref:uncharacterized protein n=1 Tax=Nicotiana sylvestris TaxID=4096 RepID=UPI00388C5C96